MTIFGLDFSHYDAVPSGARVVAEGFQFMTHKAGGDANDAELAAWWRALKPYRDNVLLGAYWVLYPGNPSDRADTFLARLDSQCVGWRDGPFILQVDCEKWNDDVSTVPPRGDIKAFCNRLVAKAPKLKPIVYAPKWVYGDSLSGLGYPLWASAYVVGTGTASALYPEDFSSRWNSYSGQVPEILQFTSSATAVGQTTCDANAYRGTLQELTALLAPGWSENMALTDTDKADIRAIVKEEIQVPLTDRDPDPLLVDVYAGNRILSHQTPDGTRDGYPQTAFYTVVKNLGIQLMAVKALVSGDNVDEAAIIAGVLAGLDPAAIAAAIPLDIASQVADELAARLAS